MKKPSLAAAMQEHDTRATATQEPPPARPSRRPAAPPAPSREGKRAVMGYFSDECKKQLKLLGVEQSKTEQAQLAEALNDYFTKYGKPTIA